MRKQEREHMLTKSELAAKAKGWCIDCTYNTDVTLYPGKGERVTLRATNEQEAILLAQVNYNRGLNVPKDNIIWDGCQGLSFVWKEEIV